MKKYLTTLICFLPSKLAIVGLKLIGHKVDWSSRIGFSIIMTDNLILNKYCKVGHFNFICVDKVSFDKKAYIGHFNFIRGPFDVEMKTTGAIGNRNIITRGARGIVYGKSKLLIGELSKITARHTLDLTRSITIGNFSTIAGSGTQIWTHGYVHGPKGKERIRVDGEIYIKDNVYIGSNCVLNAGIVINSAITVGSNSTVSKDLKESGMYVGQGLRFFKKNIDDVKSKLNKVTGYDLAEEVYEK